MPQTFTHEDLLLAAMEARVDSVWTALPGRIENYNASTQTADVQPTVQHAFIDETGERITEVIPPIPAVPVIFLGGGGYRTTYPVSGGDTCLVIFTHSSIDRWLAQGGVVDPGDDRRHTLSDAVCLVGLRTQKNTLSSAPTNAMSIGKDAGPTIEIDSSNVKLGGSSATDAVIKGTTYRSAEDTLLSKLSIAFAAISTFAATCLGPTAGQITDLQTALTTVETAISTFKSGASSYLSLTVETV